MDGRWWKARETEPPKTVDLARHLDLTSSEHITLDLNDRIYLVPPHTRFVRYGLSQEGLSVDYQDGDGAWHPAVERHQQPFPRQEVSGE